MSKKNSRVKIKKKIDNKKYINNRIFIILISIILFIGLLICSYFIYLNINGESKYLKISLNGSKEITLEYGEEYKDLGSIASYKNKDLTKNIKETNNVDFEKIGNYKYTYTIEYKKQTKSIVRIVNIVDTVEPNITLNGNAVISIYVGDNYQEEGAN